MTKSYFDKLLKWDSALEKQAQGYSIGVLHLHSNYSHDVPNLPENGPDQLVDKALQGGADFVAITDHDTDKAWRERDFHHPAWIRGAEIEVKDDTIGYPVHLGILNYPDEATFDDLIEIATKKRNAYLLVDRALQCGATVIGNHPWHGPGGSKINSIAYWRLMEAFSLPVELNNKSSLIENLATLIYAAKRKLPVVSTTDSHTRDVLPVCTLARGKTPAEFLESIRKGDTLCVPGYAGLIKMPGMMAYYVNDVIQSNCDKVLLKKTPTLNEGKVVDCCLSFLSQNNLINKLPVKLTTSLIASACAYLIGAFGYIPYLYLSAISKICTDIYLRSGQEQLLPELVSE